jgi:peptidoglycan hydrolase CwlO-like protein
MSKRVLLSVVLSMLMLPAMTMAQDRSGDSNRGDRGGDRGDRGRGGWDPARMREGFLNQIKDEMKPSDEEWKVIQPKLEKVMDARREAGGFGGRGGRGRGDSNSEEQRSSVDQARDDLRKTVENKDASADEISKRLAALREAKEKAKASLTSAQKDLKEVLTQRQEAILVMWTMLD